MPTRLTPLSALWPTLREAPMEKLLRVAAPAVLLCALPIYAQQPSPASSMAVAVAPLEEQLGPESGPGIEAPAAVQPQIVPKNDRLSGCCRIT